MTEIEDVDRARAAAEHEAQAIEARIQGSLLLAALILLGIAVWLA